MKRLITILTMAAILPRPVIAAPLGPAYDAAYRAHMTHFRQEGLRGDRSHASRMTETLQAVDDSEGCYTLLHALAQLGATAALPAFDQVINTSKSPDLVNYARAAKARLVAEDATRTLSASARPAAVAAGLLDQLDLTANGINEAVTSYKANLAAWNASNPPMDSLSPPAPVELFAMRELADIAYRSGHAPPKEVAGLSFDLDPGVALKVRLAPLTREQRIATLVEVVSHKQNPTTYYASQLLEDEGSLAHQAILKKIQELDASQDAQRDRPGHYGWLYAVLKQTDASEAAAAASPDVTTTEPHELRIQYAPGY